MLNISLNVKHGIPETIPDINAPAREIIDRMREFFLNGCVAVLTYPNRRMNVPALPIRSLHSTMFDD